MLVLAGAVYSVDGQRDQILDFTAKCILAALIGKVLISISFHLQLPAGDQQGLQWTISCWGPRPAHATQPMLNMTFMQQAAQPAMNMPCSRSSVNRASCWGIKASE